MKIIVQHSMKSVEHYTPELVIESARETMGGIDLDPASTTFVNAHRVKAERFFTRHDDGLSQKWEGKVWLNPPGGVIRKGRKMRSSAAVWWDKLEKAWRKGKVEQAIFLGFSVEILATAQDSATWMGDLPFCVPRKRLQFETKVKREKRFDVGRSPSHANVIVYLPPADGGRRARAIAKFKELFSPFGKVRT